MRDEDGKLWGSEIPRIYTPPLRELTPETSLGFSVIDFATLVLRMDLLPWQKWLFIHALEIEGDLSGDWRFRFRTVVVIIARQNGKTEMSKILVQWFLYILGVPLVIGTAQTISMSKETWRAVVDSINGNAELRKEFSRITRSNGNEELELTGNRRYKIAPLSTKGGRGFTGDLIILDELREHRNFNAWRSLKKTTLTREQSLVWCISNAGEADSVLLRHLRLKSHELLGDPDGICKQLEALTEPKDDVGDDLDDKASATRRGYFEWSAHPNAPKEDREEWALANPSLGWLISEDTLAAEMDDDDDISFRIECMCQWIDVSINSAFPGDSWENGKDPDSYIAPDATKFYGVDMAADHGHVAAAVCGLRKDRNWHIEVMEYATNITTIIGLIRHRAAKEGSITVALQGRGANISQFADTLEAIQGVKVIRVEGADLTAYHGRFFEGIAVSETGSTMSHDAIYHRPQPILDLGQAFSQTKALGDGAWVFDRKKSQVDVSALTACVMAYGSATAEPIKPKRMSAYSDGHELVFL
jgi:phage terminase large subunit-like protein